MKEKKEIINEKAEKINGISSAEQKEFNASNENNKNSNKKYQIISIILAILVLCLSLFIVYDKVISNDEEKNKENNQNNNVEVENPNDDNDVNNNVDPEKPDDELTLSSNEIEDIRTKMGCILESGACEPGTKYQDNQENFSYRYNLFLDSPKITEAEKNYIALTINYYAEEFIPRADYDKIIKKENAEKTYESYFGGKMNHSIEPSNLPPSYSYDSFYNVYYGTNRGGGISTDVEYLYLYDYTKVKSDTVTVKLARAFGNLNPSVGYPFYNICKDKKCKMLYAEKKENFQIDETNKDEFETYLFTFKKNKNNEFSFDSIEKIKTI